MITAKDRLQAINTLISHASTRDSLRALIEFHLAKTVAQFDSCDVADTNTMVYVAGKRAALKELAAYTEWSHAQLQAEIKKIKE
jgi:hypothetical protein